MASVIGQFALTGIHHTPVLVHRSGEQRYEIYAMRTFALSVWEWLSDAALPLGLRHHRLGADTSLQATLALYAVMVERSLPLRRQGADHPRVCQPLIR